MDDSNAPHYDRLNDENRDLFTSETLLQSTASGVNNFICELQSHSQDFPVFDRLLLLVTSILTTCLDVW